MSIIKRILAFIETRLSRPSLSYWRTIYINLRTLPFSQALSFPIRIYGHVRLASLDGQIVIPDNIKLKIGLNYASYRHVAPGRISIMGGGRLIVGSNVQISQGVSLLVHKNAILQLKDYSTLGDSTTVICYRKIIIGRYSDITWQSQVMDFNSHFICYENGMISNIISPVVIGDYCWIGNRTTIMPGTHLPNRTIVGSNSLLNKNYILYIPTHSMIAGIPARLKKTSVRRIYDPAAEHALTLYFANSNTPILGEAYPEEH